MADTRLHGRRDEDDRGDPTGNVESFRAAAPDIEVIFASGYNPDMVRQKSLRELKPPIIGKPLKISALPKMIRSVLEGTGRQPA